MVREAITELKEAKPKAIIEHIRKKYPNIRINESSFRADIIGCSVNHSSSYHYPGMPKFLFFEKARGTYRLYVPESNGEMIAFAATKSESRRTVEIKFTASNRDIEIGRKILEAFEEGLGMFEEYHSESGNDIGMDYDLYLNYITFTSSIDYQKNIEANVLWRTAKKWVQEYPWLFKPKELLSRKTDQIIEHFRRIRERSGGVFRVQDIGIWLYIADALQEYEGKTRKLLESFDFDALRIFRAFRGRLKKRFPFLSGDKILPMWLKILEEDGDVPLKNMHGLPLPVDKNVAEVTYNLILKRKFDGNVDTKVKSTVRIIWKQIADKINCPVIRFDTPLWILGGNKGCSGRQSRGGECNSCPVKFYCYLNSKEIST